MAAAELRVISGPMVGERIPLDADLILGRGQAGAGDLGGDTELSREHARIGRTDRGHFLIEDLGSTNGTRVNGREIGAPQTLENGDRIEVGATELELITAVPPRRPEIPPPDFGASGRGHPAVDPSKARRRRLLVAAGAGLVVVAVGVAIVVASRGGESETSRGGATVAGDCGVNLGSGGESIGYVTYVESNVARTNANSVIIMPYNAGDLKPLTPSQCSTGGSGSADLTDSGVLDADNQVLLNPQRTLLFAVNQGSDTIAVFQVQTNGGLKPAPGSPFPSGGSAPSSLGLSGSTLVVANKGQDGVRNLSSVAPNYTTFSVGSQGQLTRVRNSDVRARPGSSPTNAFVPPEGGVAFATEESGPMRGFNITAGGVLNQGSNSPLDPDQRIFGPGFDPTKKFGLGIAALPQQHILYIGMPTVPAIAVYAYSHSGRLEYLNTVADRGGYLPCWIVVTPNSRWMYAANADTNNVTAYDLANPFTPTQLQTLSFDQPGNPWNTALDPSGHYLFVNAPRDTYKVPPGEGNIQHVMRIGGDGRLTELNSSPARIPVPEGVNPQGLAVMPISG